MERFSHQDAYEEAVDMIVDLANRIDREEYPSGKELDDLHYKLLVEFHSRGLNGTKLFED